MRVLKTALICSALVIFIAACGETTSNNTITSNNANSANNSATTAKPTSTIDELASARKVYNERCVKCHKEDGSGGVVDIEGTKINSEDLRTEKMKKMDDAKYIKYITDGIPDEGMPAFKGILSEAEIKDVVKFIRAEFQSK